MRIGIMATVGLLAAIPAFAQQAPKDVHGPRTLLPWMVACADTPVTAKPDPRIRIKGVRSSGGLAMATRGGEIDLPRSANDGLDVGQRYAVRRLAGDPKMFPREGEGYGAVTTVGWITITAIDQYNALANVDFACIPMEPGDYLEVYEAPPLPTSASAMVKPDFSDRAAILQGTDSKVMFGDGDILSIERGSVHGVAVGARYAIYRDPRTGTEGMPLFYLADAVVTEVGTQTSKLVVVKAVDAVTTEDVAVPRRPTQQ
jgi:hypothetical protein